VSGPPGTLLKVTATLTGGDHPAGAIQFRLYSTTDCSGIPVDSETVSVDGTNLWIPDSASDDVIEIPAS
jgi:hypothetical protein